MTAMVAGVVLAGGRARRMGGAEKAFLTLGGKSLLQRVIGQVAPQVKALLVNANGDPARFDDFGLPVVADSCEGGLGPLAGVLSGMEWARNEHPECDWLLSVPVDTPFLPGDLLRRLAALREEEAADIAMASSGGRLHPVVGLWPVALADALQHALMVENVRKMEDWTAHFEVAVAAYETEPFDPFLNINSPADLAAAAAVLAT